jgi:3-(3-hydroxy-phenyl)propionate hydroxylase
MGVPSECDVVIAGLGPTGALLANLLGQRGWSVVAFDRDEDIYYAPRAVHFDDEIMRIFQDAGLADVIGGSAESFSDMAFRLKARGPDVLRAKVGSQDGRYGHPGAWWFHQPTLERQLHDGLKRFPRVFAQRGAEIIGFEQETGNITVQVRSVSGDICQVRGKYLIGCDGGRSFVRRAAGLTLESADFDQPWVVVDTKARCGGKEPSLPPYHFQVCDPAQPVTYVPMAGPYYEWQFMVTGNLSEREATDPNHIRQQLKPYVDLDKIEITRIAYYTFHGLWAKEWCKGRIILAGDAAHQMPPFLGQGMCSGARDAHALAWRLDLILSGRSEPMLLNDYVAERADHVDHIIQGAMFLGSVIQTRNPVIAFLRNVFLFRLTNLIPPLNEAFVRTANRKRPLSGGCFGTNRPKVAGHLMPQPVVRVEAGELVLLDELLGQGFAIVARKGELVAAQHLIADLARRLPLRLIELGPMATGQIVADPTGNLEKFLHAHDSDFAIIRPDRYFFDAGRAAEFSKCLSSLIGHLELVKAEEAHAS